MLPPENDTLPALAIGAQVGTPHPVVEALGGVATINRNRVRVREAHAADSMTLIRVGEGEAEGCGIVWCDTEEYQHWVQRSWR